MVDGAILKTGQDVRLIVEEELRLEQEPAQTLLLHTEELTVKETVAKTETVTHILAQVSFWKRNLANSNCY